MIVNLSDSVFAEFQALEVGTFDDAFDPTEKIAFVDDLLDGTTRRIRSSGRLVHRIDFGPAAIEYALRGRTGAIARARAFVEFREPRNFREASLDANILRSLDALERKLRLIKTY